MSTEYNKLPKIIQSQTEKTGTLDTKKSAIFGKVQTDKKKLNKERHVDHESLQTDLKQWKWNNNRQQSNMLFSSINKSESANYSFNNKKGTQFCHLESPEFSFDTISSLGDQEDEVESCGSFSSSLDDEETTDGHMLPPLTKDEILRFLTSLQIHEDDEESLAQSSKSSDGADVDLCIVSNVFPTKCEVTVFQDDANECLSRCKRENAFYKVVEKPIVKTSVEENLFVPLDLKDHDFKKYFSRSKNDDIERECDDEYQFQDSMFTTPNTKESGEIRGDIQSQKSSNYIELDTSCDNEPFVNHNGRITTSKNGSNKSGNDLLSNLDSLDDSSSKGILKHRMFSEEKDKYRSLDCEPRYRKRSDDYQLSTQDIDLHEIEDIHCTRRTEPFVGNDQKFGVGYRNQSKIVNIDRECFSRYQGHPEYENFGKFRDNRTSRRFALDDSIISRRLGQSYIQSINNVYAFDDNNLLLSQRHRRGRQNEKSLNLQEDYYSPYNRKDKTRIGYARNYQKLTWLGYETEVDRNLNYFDSKTYPADQLMQVDFKRRNQKKNNKLQDFSDNSLTNDTSFYNLQRKEGINTESQKLKDTKENTLGMERKKTDYTKAFSEHKHSGRSIMNEMNHSNNPRNITKENNKTENSICKAQVSDDKRRRQSKFKYPPTLEEPTSIKKTQEDPPEMTYSPPDNNDYYDDTPISISSHVVNSPAHDVYGDSEKVQRNKQPNKNKTHQIQHLQKQRPQERWDMLSYGSSSKLIPTTQLQSAINRDRVLSGNLQQHPEEEHWILIARGCHTKKEFKGWSSFAQGSNVSTNLDILKAWISEPEIS